MFLLSVRGSLKESTRDLSERVTGRYQTPNVMGQEEVGGVLQILHEVSRGLSKALIVVISVGIEVWCTRERGAEGSSG